MKLSANKTARLVASLLFLLPFFLLSSCGESNPIYEEPGGEVTTGDDKKDDNSSVVDENKPKRNPEVTQYLSTPYGELGLDGAVDLGLSVKWAAFNLGAESAGDIGLGYTWGDSRNDCLTDIAGTLYDRARTDLGIGWQMPTKAQWVELINDCKKYPYVYRGWYGALFAGPSGKAIFLPMTQDSERASQYYYPYWSSTLDIQSNNAYVYYLHYSNPVLLYDYDRTKYWWIRPVYIGS